MRALLDVNVLIALLDPDHVHHARVVEWLASEVKHGWATCPITENGCVRILSQPGYQNPVSTATVLASLTQSTRQAAHQFWPADISILDGSAVHPARLHGPRQVTDVYLLALAVRHGGRLVTLDGRVPLSAVPGARPEHLVVL